MIGMHKWQAMIAKDAEQRATIARLTKNLERWLHDVAKIQSQVDRLTAERDAANQRAAASVEAVARANAERDAQIKDDPRVQALVKAGDVMANALRGHYIVPGAAMAWDAALAALEKPCTES